jgi:dTDP-4-dehydrorhamnose reductase
LITIPCDVLDRQKVQSIIHLVKPDYVIYAIGLTSKRLCHEFPKLAEALNTMGVFNVTEYAERARAKVILLSSAYIFGGEARDYQENDTPDPVNNFGRTKASAEFYIQKSCLNYLIFRCCNLYGRSFHPRAQTFFEALQSQLLGGESVSVDDRVRGGFLDVDILGVIIKNSIESEISNRLFQVSSLDTCSHYQFALWYCEIFQDDKSKIKKSIWPFYDSGGVLGSNENLNYKMDILNLESYFAVKLPTVYESLEFTMKKMSRSKVQKGKSRGSTGISFI